MPIIFGTFSRIGCVSKIRFTRNRRIVGWLGSSPPLPRNFFIRKNWNCWENFEIKDAKRYILTTWRCFGSWCYGETFEIKDVMMCILEICERCFGRCNCLEENEIMEAKRYILTQFETIFWKLELPRNLKIKTLTGAF